MTPDEEMPRDFFFRIIDRADDIVTKQVRCGQISLMRLQSQCERETFLKEN